ncbi:hypothetical protein GOODEAATRI_002423, partial [Goodea atripinnis]
LSTMTPQCDMIKKREDQMLKQIEERLCQQSRFRDHLILFLTSANGLKDELCVFCYRWENFTRLFFSRQAKLKQESKEEEQQFLQEIVRFNDDFSLSGNRATVLESQAHAEIMALQSEAEALHKGH